MPIPTGAGTNFSYLKTVGLDVTVTGATAISNRKVNMSGALSTGLSLWWYAPAAYTQNSGTTGTTIGNYPAASGSNGATPANPAGQTYAAMTTSAVVYDSASVSTGSTGINGKYLVLTMGVDFTFAGGGGAASMGSLQITYDEQ